MDTARSNIAHLQDPLVEEFILGVEQNARPGLKALLLGDELRFEDLVPARRALKRRPPVELQ